MSLTRIGQNCRELTGLKKVTIKDIIAKYPELETELLLAHVLKKPKEFLFLHPEASLSANQQISVSALVKRRARGEPMSYVLGYKDFYGLRFSVNKNVLIPRPETEWVVKIGHEVLKMKHEASSKEHAMDASSFMFHASLLRILDVGTGSGAIIVSLAHTLARKVPRSPYGVELAGSDVSKKALNVAKSNARRLLSPGSPKFRFYHSNLLKNVPGDFDIIIANLSYGWQGFRNRFSMSGTG